MYTAPFLTIQYTGTKKWEKAWFTCVGHHVYSIYVGRQKREGKGRGVFFIGEVGGGDLKKLEALEFCEMVEKDYCNKQFS